MSGKGQLEARLLTLVTLALVAFGLVMVYSATSAPAALGDGDPGYYLKKQGVYALAGLVLLVVASRMPYRSLRHLAPTLVVVSLGLLLAVLVVGEAVNGARRWLTFGPAVFQPSELAKVSLAIWAAAYLARTPAPRTLGELAKPLGLLALVFCGLVLIQPDLGTAITIMIMLGGVLLVSGTPPALLGVAGVIVTVAGLAAIWLEPYRRARLFAFLDPWSDPQNSGFQSVQALIGLGSGGVFGEGLGQGISKVFYLPEAHTDMIFAIVGEELGLIGSTLVIAAYGAFAYAGLQVALHCADPFGKRLAASLTALVCGKAAVNLAAVLGLAPLTGIPLPFVSAGGSSLVVMLTGVGVLLNIASGGGRKLAAVPDRGRRNGRPRAARARDSGSTPRARSGSDVRRVAGARRGSARR
jgi:cell division protein FtsW